jgi:Ran-binding protein 3
MRKEAVHSLILNVPLFRGMSFALQQDPRFLRFSAIEDGRTTHYNLKVASAKVAQELLSEIRMNVPAELLTEAV